MFNSLKNKISKLGFIIIAAIAFTSYAGTAKAANKNAKATANEVKTFKNWTYFCDNAKDPKNRLCYITQILSTESKDSKTNKVQPVQIASYRIGYFNSDKGKPVLKILETLPLGCLLQPGTGIILSDTEIVAKGIYSVCHKDGCISVSEINEEILNKIITSKTALVAFFTIENKQTNLPMYLDGLSDAFKYLKSHK